MGQPTQLVNRRISTTSAESVSPQGTTEVQASCVCTSMLSVASTSATALPMTCGHAGACSRIRRPPMKQPGGFAVWQEPFSVLRVPKVFNLRMDPFERVVSDQYNNWIMENAYLVAYLSAKAAAFLQTNRQPEIGRAHV